VKGTGIAQATTRIGLERLLENKPRTIGEEYRLQEQVLQTGIPVEEATLPRAVAILKSTSSLKPICVLQDAHVVCRRRKRRDAMTVNVWPPSPKEPARDLSPHGHSRSKHDKKDKHRSKDKDKKRSKHRSRSEDRHRKKHEEDDRKRYDSDRKRKRRRSRSTSPSETETDSSEDRRRRKRRERERDRDRDYERDDRKSRSKSHDARDSRPLEMEEDEDAWVEKPATSMAPPPVPVQTSASNQVATIANEDMYDDDEDSDMEEVGPQLPIRTKEKIDERSYGGALLRGEGSAMAAFLQADPHTRIPRRGEIGEPPFFSYPNEILIR
jgi:hypothetical protein